MTMKNTLGIALISLLVGPIACAVDAGEQNAENDEETVAKVEDALISNLGIDDITSGTIIDGRYRGVTFSEPLHGGHVYAVEAMSGQGNVISIHDPSDPNWGPGYASDFAAEEGAVDATFSTLQQSVSIDAQLITAPEELGVRKIPYFQAFDSAGTLLTTVYYPSTRAVGWQTLTITRGQADIKRVRFSSQNNWAGLTGCPRNCPNRIYGGHYGEFDNLRYDDGRGALRGYLGCYVDNPGRALPVTLIAMNATVTSCVNLARSKGYAFAGLQAGGQCMAGNVLGFESADPYDCSTPCSADPSQYCGGDWRNSMYATGVRPVPGQSGKYLGCYVDDAVRTLPVGIFDSGATIETCVAAAQARGLRYAGVQAGGQCFAGNVLPSTSAPSYECGTPCNANVNEMCGGSWRNSVYDTSVPTPPSVPGDYYYGCYTDDWSRALPVQLMPSGGTVESCAQAARAAGYYFAGLQDGGQCFAGNSVGFTRVSDAECSAPCTANSGQRCGAQFRNSIWYAF